MPIKIELVRDKWRNEFSELWIAFSLLGVVVGRMIYADLRPKTEDEPEALPSRGVTTLLVLAVATSIDALVVGFSLTFVPSILLPVLIIGLVTFSLCFAGVNLGYKYRRIGRGEGQIVEGVILIAIGVKVLVEHLS